MPVNANQVYTPASRVKYEAEGGLYATIESGGSILGPSLIGMYRHHSLLAVVTDGTQPGHGQIREDAFRDNWHAIQCTGPTIELHA